MRQKSLVQTMMLLLVKSGCIDCVLQIINAVVVNLVNRLAYYDTPRTYASDSVMNICMWATAVYPMAVILVARIIVQQTQDDCIVLFQPRGFERFFDLETIEVQASVNRIMERDNLIIEILRN
ncbi:hypothetical protein H2248_003984 [Termitomyces sp. 'cryptogamus']|nr:hypothetical protein H2248_003984 [Termitomyces sp. 'cryptogamus']